ncbi:MAG: hypothetical protein FD135_2452 [Comamonadaceae bacterium]|nr:MAG: hypothetical protein FD135_2452 [Comamonadaceae bacterium]
MSSFAFINTTGTKLALAAVFAASLAACGGSSGTPTVAAVSAPVTVGVQTTTSAAATAVLANQTFTFANTATLTNGVNGAADIPFTKLAFTTATATGAVPFTLTQASGTSIKGEMTFGSCIFTVKEMPVGTVLTTPLVYTIPTAQCQIKVDTTNAAANGSTVNRAVTYTIGLSASSATSIPVTVSATGQITVAGVVVGTGTVVQVTGAN